MTIMEATCSLPATGTVQEVQVPTVVGTRSQSLSASQVARRVTDRRFIQILRGKKKGK